MLSRHFGEKMLCLAGTAVRKCGQIPQIFWHTIVLRRQKHKKLRQIKHLMKTIKHRIV